MKGRVIHVALLMTVLVTTLLVRKLQIAKIREKIIALHIKTGSCLVGS